MKRDVDLKEISDGRLYTANDMVKADCHDCKGCHACCCGMGNSIVLDPLDVHRLCQGLQVGFETLLKDKLELQVVDGLVLPNLKMIGEEERCGFLNEEGRCSVHPYRPGICRMFPLGRVYEGDDFHYFLQVYECPVKKKGKVKVKKWIDMPELKSYEEYIKAWHQFLIQCQKEAESLEPEQLQVLTMFLLKVFYKDTYGAEFFGEFKRRLEDTKKKLNLAG
ncbi:MAG: YkgJ family cysteine cluster protein [Eubacterium sp.]|nr:YkgJ family cysteine cluster protein [Eubacterium sp.]